MLDFEFQGIGYLLGSTELACISWQKLDVCLFPILCSVTSHWVLEVGHGESICTMEINKCYKSGFFFLRTSLPEHHLYNSYPYKASSLASSQKDKLPTSVPCKKVLTSCRGSPQNGGHPFYISALKDSYKGGVIWILKKECGRAGKIGYRGKTFSAEERAWVHVWRRESMLVGWDWLVML